MPGPGDLVPKSKDSSSWGRRDIVTWVMRGLKEKMSRQGWELETGGLCQVGFRDNFLEDRAFVRALKDGRIWESHMEEACGKLGSFQGHCGWAVSGGGAGGMVQPRPFRVWWSGGGSQHPLSKCFISHQHLTGVGKEDRCAPHAHGRAASRNRGYQTWLHYLNHLE